MPRGYDHALYILPFDHRGSFQVKLFAWTPPLGDAQTAEIAGAKQVIYEDFQRALLAGVPIVIACPAEKSGKADVRRSPGPASRVR